jgi:hypothetical protein
MNAEEAAEIIGCVAAHVRLMRRRGRIDGKLINRRSFVFERAEVEKLAAEYRSAPPNRGGRPRKT